MCAASRLDRVLAAIRQTLALKEQPNAWRALSRALRASLSSDERACLLVSVAEACDTDPLFEVMELIAPAKLAGAPLPSFLDIEDDARWWADMATLPEIRAYLAACFVRLPAREQLAFLEDARRRAAA